MSAPALCSAPATIELIHDGLEVAGAEGDALAGGVEGGAAVVEVALGGAVWAVGAGRVTGTEVLGA